MNPNNWKKLILIFIAIGVVTMLVKKNASTTRPLVNQSEVQANKQEMQVAVSSQDAMGKTQKDLDLNFLNNLEAYTVERLKIKTKEYLASQGNPNGKVDLTSEAVYVEYGKMKLAVVRIHSPEGGSNVWVTGIRDNEIKRIVCISGSTETIPISYGTCGDKIEEVFGKRIGG